MSNSTKHLAALPKQIQKLRKHRSFHERSLKVSLLSLHAAREMATASDHVPTHAGELSNVPLGEEKVDQRDRSHASRCQEAMRADGRTNARSTSPAAPIVGTAHQMPRRHTTMAASRRAIFFKASDCAFSCSAAAALSSEFAAIDCVT